MPLAPKAAVIAAALAAAGSLVLPPAAGAAGRAPAGTVVAGSQPSGTAAFLGPARLLRVGTVQLAYRQFGKGPDLLVISGYASPMNLWGTELPKLMARHFRVTMFDNRGMGYSTDDASQPETIQLLAADAAGLIKTLRLDRPTVVGWSMGGQIALTLAVRSPGLASRLVVSGADFGGTHAVQPDAATEEALTSPSTTPQEFLNLLFPPSAGAAESAFVAQLEKVPSEPTPVAGLIREGEAEGAWYQYEGTYRGLPKVQVPVAVTNGTLDVINPAANARLISRRLRHGRVTLFTGAGHAMLFQDVPRFSAIVAGGRSEGS